MSGKNLPYEPEPLVNPSELIAPGEIFPTEPLISSYTRPESENVVVVISLLLSVNLTEPLLPDRFKIRSNEPGKSFSLYLALSTEIT